MGSRDRVVTAIPLESVWGTDGHDLQLTREEPGLSLDNVKGLLRDERPAFVVADVGEPLVWVEGNAVYCYLAEEWKGPDGHVIVLAKPH